MPLARLWVLGTAGAALGVCMALTLRSLAGEVRMTTIINNPALPASVGLPAPDFDSGWQAIDPGQSWTSPAFNIPNGSGDPDKYFVFLQFLDNRGYHIRNLGGGGDEGGAKGACWRLLEANSITLERFKDGSDKIDKIRVRVWDYGRAP